MYHKLDACDLYDLIEEVYGIKFNVAYYWLQDQRSMEVVGVCRDPAESDAWCRQKLEGAMTGEKWDLSMPPLDEYILNDLCNKGKLEEGDYFIVFDD